MEPTKLTWRKLGYSHGHRGYAQFSAGNGFPPYKKSSKRYVLHLYRGTITTHILCMHGMQEGKPDGDHKSDPEGKPESTASKAVKGSVKLAAKITKIVAKNSGLVDDETADIISAVADAAENQAEAGRDATITDRLKMGGRCKLQYR